MSELLLDVSQLREARARVDRTLAPDAVAADQAVCRVVDPIGLQAEVSRDRDTFRLAGHVRSALELTCCRCLEPFRLPVDEAFDVLYLPHRENAGEGEREVEDDDLATAFYRDQVLDLGQLVLEQFYLAVPMKPLCREDCRGLCPLCGTNLNTAPCSCTVAWEDPRLAPLRNLLKKD
jgi:uncharacterized protein